MQWRRLCPDRWEELKEGEEAKPRDFDFVRPPLDEEEPNPEVVEVMS